MLTVGMANRSSRFAQSRRCREGSATALNHDWLSPKCATVMFNVARAAIFAITTVDSRLGQQ